MPKKKPKYSNFNFTAEQEIKLLQGSPDNLINDDLFKGYPRWALRRKKQELLEEFAESKTNFIDNGQTATATGKTIDRIMTPEELLEHFKIDLDIWYVDRQVVNKWEVARKDSARQINWSKDGVIKKGSFHKDRGEMRVQQLFQIKVFLKRKHTVGFDPKIFRKNLIKDVKLIKVNTNNIIKDFQIKVPNKNNNLLLLNIFDLHYDKLSWDEETGYNWDPKIAEKTFWEAMEVLLGYANNFPISEIWFPIGNDFFNSDKDYPSSTTAGTPQQLTDRWQRTFREGRMMLAKAIIQLSKIAPIKVPVIPGNHDWQKAFYLGDSLDCFFHDNPNITIDNKANPRKYYTYGKNLIGFTHGKEEKIGDLHELMSVLSPNWSASKYRFMYLGHIHQERKISHISSKDVKGLIVEFLPSLTATDAWHNQKGFTGQYRGCKAYIHNAEKGRLAVFSHYEG